MREEIHLSKEYMYMIVWKLYETLLKDNMYMHVTSGNILDYKFLSAFKLYYTFFAYYKIEDFFLYHSCG